MTGRALRLSSTTPPGSGASTYAPTRMPSHFHSNANGSPAGVPSAPGTGPAVANIGATRASPAPR